MRGEHVLGRLGAVRRPLPRRALPRRATLGTTTSGTIALVGTLGKSKQLRSSSLAELDKDLKEALEPVDLPIGRELLAQQPGKRDRALS